MKTRKPMNPNRAALIELSKAVKLGMKSGMIDAENVNAALIEIYSTERNCSEFKTISAWREDGRKLKKGCKAVWIWGAPRKTTSKEDKPSDNEATSEEDGGKLKFWPMAKLFAACDTEPMSDKMKAYLASKAA